MLNPDLKVIVEPLLEKFYIAKPLLGQEEAQAGSKVNFDYDKNSVDGIYCPIITVNNTPIDGRMVLDFEIETKDFFPTLHLEIDDPNRSIQWQDVPGFNNQAYIVIRPLIDGAYKAIKLEFYLTNVEFSGTSVIYDGILKLLPLEQIKVASVSDNGNYALTTYQTFKKIAEQTGIGFSADSSAQTVADKNLRLVQWQTYKDFIVELIFQSGTDETTILDTWVDFYGYLNLANVYWLLNNDFTGANMTIKCIDGIQTGQSSVKTAGNGPQEREVPRVLNTDAGNGWNNMVVRSYNSIVDNTQGYVEGTLNNYSYMNTLANQGGNDVINASVQLKENSLDGLETNEYQFETQKFLGFEMSEYTPVLYQTEIRKAYWKKIKAKQLEITMKYPNFGLLRGQLIGLLTIDYNMVNKSASIRQADNANMENAVETWDKAGDSATPKEKSLYNDPMIPALNDPLSGLYYINEMSFAYDREHTEIVQKLLLIKAGELTNYNNKLTMPQV